MKSISCPPIADYFMPITVEDYFLPCTNADYEGCPKIPWTSGFSQLSNVTDELNFDNINKRPMGHMAHLRKQFKAINTYDYIITLVKRKKLLLTL